MGSHLAASTVVLERKEQTLAFVMSLPVSYREYTASKILSNLLIFLIPWLTLVVGSIVVIMLGRGIPHGMVPFVVIMSTEILVSTCFVVAVAVISESQGWTIAAIMVGNLALNVIGYYVAHIPSIAKRMWGTSVHWSFAAIALLFAEFAAAAAILWLTFLIQSRKKDFL